LHQPQGNITLGVGDLIGKQEFEFEAVLATE
jgi:hypothetical protein